jgi:TRAP-type uncharacterized transport system fused permease subunit
MNTKNNMCRLISDKVLLVAAFAAISLSVFQIWQGITADLSAPIFRPIHLSWILILVFFTLPLIKSQQSSFQYLFGRSLDLLCIIALTWASYHIVSFDYGDISFLMDGLTTLDQLSGLIIMVLLLEATRRTVGLVMVFIALTFLLYAIFGNILPSNLASKGFSIEEIVRFHIYSTNGIYGAPLAIAAGVVFIFVLFGAFLQVSGAGKFFIDASFSIAGKYRGGPAKASVTGIYFRFSNSQYGHYRRINHSNDEKAGL